MKLTEWLKQRHGRSKELAAFIGVTPGAVSQWGSESIPVERMRLIQDFTSGEVTLEDMVPQAKENVA